MVITNAWKVTNLMHFTVIVVELEFSIGEAHLQSAGCLHSRIMLKPVTSMWRNPKLFKRTMLLPKTMLIRPVVQEDHVVA
ncbi:hypothetical protein VNO77_20042 [Canavalia gladiata]|uniref:Uncharacterized protein n=1 Tax=Canavalia gladiata TaxID=3824 RepID=A0AAN9QKY2_CANGL